MSDRTKNETFEGYKDAKSLEDFHVVYLNHRGEYRLHRTEALDSGDAHVTMRIDPRTGQETPITMPASFLSTRRAQYEIVMTPGLNAIHKDVLAKYGPNPHAALDFRPDERPHTDPDTHPPRAGGGCIVDFAGASAYEVRDWLRVATNSGALKLLRRLDSRPDVQAMLSDVLAEMDARSPEAGVRRAEEALELAAARLAEAQREALEKAAR